MAIAHFAENSAVGRPPEGTDQLTVGALHYRRKSGIKLRVVIKNNVFCRNRIPRFQTRAV